MSDLLPWNATTQERALSETISRISNVPTPLRDLWYPDTCPPKLLGWLAEAFSVDKWDSNWSDTQKREVIKSSVEVHRRKGTIGAVREAIKALALDSQVQEWFAQIPASDPYTFVVLLTADQVGITQDQYASVFEVIERTKNLRSHLTGLQLTMRSVAQPHLAVAAGVGSEITLSRFVLPAGSCNETAICF